MLLLARLLAAAYDHERGLYPEADSTVLLPLGPLPESPVLLTHGSRASYAQNNTLLVPAVVAFPARAPALIEPVSQAVD
jgi:hypothetical protein